MTDSSNPRSAAAIGQTIKDTWRDIEEWYRQYAPRLLEDIPDGASEAEIGALEGQFGLTLPDDDKASLRIHNGDVNVHDYHYMTIDSVAATWAMMTELSDNGAFTGWPAASGLSRTGRRRAETERVEVMS